MIHTLALLEEDYRRRGVTPEQARAAARRAMGSVALANDLYRDARSFIWIDDASGVQAMLVNEAFVRTFLQDVEPNGFETDGILSGNTRAQVVGVVDNVLKEGLDALPQPEVYIVPAHRHVLSGEVHVLVRTLGDPASVAGALRSVVGTLRSDVAIDSVTTLRAETLESVGTSSPLRREAATDPRALS